MRDHITTAQLQRMADDIEKVVRQLGLATDEELTPWRPGGTQNLGTDADGWLKWYTRVQRIHGRQESRSGSGDPGAGMSEAQAEADRIITAALSNTPELVKLYATPPALVEEHGGTFAVYPKSFHAMLTLKAIDQALEMLDGGLEYLWAEDTATAYDHVGLALEQIGYRHSLAMWILHHPEPGIPYDDRASLFPTVPPLYRQIDTLDVHRIMNAGQVVNGLRLKYLETLLQAKLPGTDGVRRGWAPFFVDAAEALKVDEGYLIRHESLVKIFARLHVGGDTSRRREQKRKAESKRTRTRARR